MTAAVVNSRPDITRSGVRVVKVSTWDVGSPEGQRAAVGAIERAWLSRPWPERGPLSYSVYAGEDGRTLLHYSQWADEDAYRAFFAEGRDERNEEIDAAVPGVRRLGLHSYELYRSRITEGDDRLPGSVAVVEVDFASPDPARARKWVDTVFAALDASAGEDEPDGGLSAHFHVGLDGSRALNFAEWTDAASHAAMMNAPGETPVEWQRVHGFDGLTGSRVRRYTPALSLSAGA
ncbi:antibiotic biosynthesis monooxygenase [Streptomyces cremeus]|uniref:Antibiotic biosynthesis monooxygenase n=1 Tax=Streptomyces cremeus TaxID=66881 RepID=A0ABV5PD98_STRCM